VIARWMLVIGVGAAGVLSGAWTRRQMDPPVLPSLAPGDSQLVAVLGGPAWRHLPARLVEPTAMPTWPSVGRFSWDNVSWRQTASATTPMTRHAVSGTYSITAGASPSVELRLDTCDGAPVVPPRTECWHPTVTTDGGGSVASEIEVLVTAISRALVTAHAASGEDRVLIATGAVVRSVPVSSVREGFYHACTADGLDERLWDPTQARWTSARLEADVQDSADPTTTWTMAARLTAWQERAFP
jgi:hypothetical protein